MGAPWSCCLSNFCRKVNEVNVHQIKGNHQLFLPSPLHQVTGFATLSYQLRWIVFCNRYRFALYNVWCSKGKWIWISFSSRQPLNNTTRVLRMFISSVFAQYYRSTVRSLKGTYNYRELKPQPILNVTLKPGMILFWTRVSLFTETLIASHVGRKILFT